jgi:hypothetical protein
MALILAQWGLQGRSPPPHCGSFPSLSSSLAHMLLGALLCSAGPGISRFVSGLCPSVTSATFASWTPSSVSSAQPSASLPAMSSGSCGLPSCFSCIRSSAALLGSRVWAKGFHVFVQVPVFHMESRYGLHGPFSWGCQFSSQP